MFNLVDVITEKALNFDEAVDYLREFEEVSKLDFDGFLNSLTEKSDDEAKNELDNLLQKVEKFAVTGKVYGYPGISVVDELKKVLQAKDIKKAVQELIEKLKKIKEGYGYPSVKGSEPTQMETVNLLNQEICAEGEFTARGIKLTKEDLEEIAKNYSILKDKVKPPLKIGHFGENMGLPALGWVENVRVEGNKLVADFMDVPKKVADFIRAKAYRRVSPELYVDFDEDGMKRGRVLKAVAILGADIPQIKTLKDLEVLYNSEEEVKNMDFVVETEEPEKPKNDTPEPNTDPKVQKLLEENIALKVDNFIEKNSSKITPAIEPLVREILNVAYLQEVEVKLTENDKEVNYSLGDAIKEIFNRLPDIVKLEELSKTKVNEPTDEETLIRKTAEELHLSEEEALKKLIKEGKIKVFVETPSEPSNNNEE